MGQRPRAPPWMTTKGTRHFLLPQLLASSSPLACPSRSSTCPAANRRVAGAQKRPRGRRLCDRPPRVRLLPPGRGKEEESWQQVPEGLPHQTNPTPWRQRACASRAAHCDWPAPRCGRGPARTSNFSFLPSRPCWRRESEAAPALVPFHSD